MSNRTLIIAVLVAIGLGVVTLLVLKKEAATTGRGSVPAGTRLIDFDPAKVRSLTITPGDGGATILVERDRAGAFEWQMTISRPGVGAPAGSAWPAGSDRIRPLLQVLATITASGAPEPGAAIGSGATRIVIALEGGRDITLKLAPRTLGGQGLIEIASPAANVPPATRPASDQQQVTRIGLVADSLHNVFMGDAPRAWRLEALLPGVMSSASRLRLVNTNGSVALGKTGGKWALTEPLAAPADPGAVQRLLQALEGLRVNRFFDEGAPEAGRTGLEMPVARVIIESDVRKVGTADQPSVSTVSRELLIGEGIDPANRQRFATIDGGATVVAVDALSLAEGLTIEPTAFISRVSTEVAAPDIGLLMFVAESAASAPGAAPGAPSMGFLRRVDGWVELRPDGMQVLLDSQSEGHVTALIRFLNTQAASSVSLAAPAGYLPLGKLSVKTAGNAPLDELEVGRSGGSANVIVRSARVYREYTGVPELLNRVLGPTQASPAVPGQPAAQPPVDITK